MPRLRAATSPGTLAALVNAPHAAVDNGAFAASRRLSVNCMECSCLCCLRSLRKAQGTKATVGLHNDARQLSNELLIGKRREHLIQDLVIRLGFLATKSDRSAVDQPINKSLAIQTLSTLNRRNAPTQKHPTPLQLVYLGIQN